MLYLFYGGDNQKKRNAIEALGQKSVFFVSKNDDYQSVIDEYAESVSLFGDTATVVFEDALGTKEGRSAILSRAAQLAQSKNSFVFLEQKALKETVAAFDKVRAAVKEFAENKKISVEKEPNVFALTDAFARRDKKQSWVLLMEAYRFGKSPEEIAGLLFWQIKNLLLAKDPRASAASAGMKPFVFSKAALAAKLWDEASLKGAASALVRATHEARRGEIDAGDALERLILTVL